MPYLAFLKIWSFKFEFISKKDLLITVKHAKTSELLLTLFKENSVMKRAAAFEIGYQYIILNLTLGLPPWELASPRNTSLPERGISSLSSFHKVANQIKLNNGGSTVPTMMHSIN